MFSGGLKLSDDEDDFTLGSENGPSNLSNIFGVAVENTLVKEAPSLRYVSPKQTKNLEKNANHSHESEWKVQVAKVVTAYKLLNQENISQGKIGLAVLANTEDQLRIILYRSKNNVLSTYTLRDDSIIYRNNLYLQFNDDLQLFWSLLFEPDDIEAVIDKLGGKITIQVQEKSDSMTEENTSDERLKDTKASILSRMAKMGKPLPILPTTATTTDLSDSSDVETKTKVIQKPAVSSRKPKVQFSAANMQIIPSTAMGGLVPFGSTNFAQVQDPQYLNVLLAENRTQNTELRINISKLETKIEKVLDKIEVIGSKTSAERHDNKEDEILELEEKILGLKKQNRTLKLQLREVEENRINSIPDTTSVHESSSELLTVPHSELQKQLIQHMTTEIQSLKDTVKQQSALLEDSHSQHQNTKDELEEVKNQLNERRIEYERNIETVRQELTAAKHDNEALSKAAREQPSVEGLLKEIMNNLYQRLSQQFQEKDQFSAIEITNICANAIKAETNNVIKRM